MGRKYNVFNYQPISFINNIGKIFEKRLKVQLNLFSEKLNLINDRQYGFQDEEQMMQSMM